jgi:hypothetical protein
LSKWVAPRSYEEENGGDSVLYGSWFAGREPSFGGDLSAEVVDGGRLVKTQKSGQDLACAVVICKLRRLAIAL